MLRFADVKVKICGITSLKDALAAVEVGADALGFVFYPPSSRYITPEAAAEIIRQLPAFVTTVGLFVNECPEVIEQVVETCLLDVVQLHGDESPQQCYSANARVIKALRIRDEESLVGIEDYPVTSLLLDAWCDQAYGGTGKVGRWDLARQIAEKNVVILAGGLTAENVAQAVRDVAPYAVDVSSGVESAPGVKDQALMSAFVQQAKYARS
nr:phosphoribosylanthranilate isomerase [uncultured Desulfuromonas sp.]